MGGKKEKRFQNTRRSLEDFSRIWPNHIKTEEVINPSPAGTRELSASLLVEKQEKNRGGLKMKNKQKQIKISPIGFAQFWE